MFSFLKKRREIQEARTKIGIDLHRQIKEALTHDDFGSTQRLSTTFTPGYIFSFVRDSFFSLSVDAGNDLESHIKFICNGVIPEKLYRIYSDQSAALAIARKLENPHKEILNLGITPAEAIKLFTLGTQSGSFDAPFVSLRPIAPDNLRRFLLNESLKVRS